MEIRTLPTEVIDQIAAGEVVERPAHLLKELIENSLDADASQIEIEVGESCREMVVTDNGLGVLPEDLPLVVKRHATSKIALADDLWNLNTFGFRGEALASISAVSDLDVISRRRGSSQAFRMHAEFGRVGESLEATLPEGTRIQVRSLFGNVPARLKFLKSEAAEFSLIKNVVRALALQYPQVEFKLKKKGELIFLFPAEKSPLLRAQKVLETGRLYEAQGHFAGFETRLVFSDPAQVAKNSKQIWLFVQNRWVQDRSLQAAVMEAYRSLLMHGQFPFCWVSLTCPPDQVDVNIHPTKSQVKFLNTGDAFRAVYHPLRQALERAPWLAKVEDLTGKMEKPSATSRGGEPEMAAASPQRSIANSPQLQSLQGQHPLSFSGPEFQAIQFPQKPRWDSPRTEGLGLSDLRELADRSENILAPRGYWSSLQVIGQVDTTYIVAQSAEQMVLIDQHAAHERVVYERLLRDWQEDGMPVQELLIPLVIDLEAAECEALLAQSKHLLKLGIEVEQAGPNSLALNSRPTAISDAALIRGLQKVAADCLEKGGSFAIEQIISDLFATWACHSVIRAGQALSHQEMEKLLLDMDEFPLSGFCPHGRSVSLEFSFERLEKDFGRRG